MTDTQILDWLENNPNTIRYHPENPDWYCGPKPKDKGFWRRLFGRKDSSNRFNTLREAVEAQNK